MRFTAPLFSLTNKIQNKWQPPKDNLQALDIDRNVKYEIRLGSKIKKIKAMNNAVSERCDELIARAEVSYSEDQKSLIVNMGKKSQTCS